MGGTEAIHQLAAIDPAVKAILVSGHVQDAAMTQFWKYGFKAVLAKPFNLKDLSRTIDHVIGASRCRVH
jgi:CheY-like chemotaxis protein